jgi:AAA+ ATPase superfamily predicted ATPase
MQHFIGRKRELHVLEAEYAKPSSFVVIYGRRRVGKTTLIKEFIKDKQALYFLATQESESQSMKGFTASLATFTGQDFLETANFSNWEALFRIFVESKSNKKKVLIIDEFQYLVQTNPAFPSIFQKAWDELLANNDIMVILCGSFISMSYGRGC